MSKFQENEHTPGLPFPNFLSNLDIALHHENQPTVHPPLTPTMDQINYLLMFLPAEDLAELVADMGTDLNEDEIYEMIRAADSDGDGQVSLEGKLHFRIPEVSLINGGYLQMTKQNEKHLDFDLKMTHSCNILHVLFACEYV